MVDKPTAISVKESTRQLLKDIKGKHETYDDVIHKLVRNGVRNRAIHPVTLQFYKVIDHH